MLINEINKKRLMELAGLNPNTIIISKGHKLFHGTGEEFDSSKIRTGGYDNIFWTTEQSAIAQTYIPVSPGTIYTSSKSLSSPTLEKYYVEIQKQLGIKYEDVEGKSGQVHSYKEASVFKYMSDRHYDGLKNLVDIDKEIKDVFNVIEKAKDLEIEKRRELLKKINELIEKQDKLKKEYANANVQRQKNKYVNEKLKSLGYVPYSKDDYELNYNWILKVKGVKTPLLRADYRTIGRLLIVIPKEELKIFDATYGGEIEGDLTDLDYHKFDLFKMAENAGYDGIKINDFAQIETEGNFGHRSIGLFKDTLKKVLVQEVPATHPENFGEKHYKTNDYDSFEYKSLKEQKEFKKNINWDNLRLSVKNDIIENLRDNSKYLQQNYWNTEALRDAIDDCVNQPIFKIDYKDVNNLYNQLKRIGWGISQRNVAFLINALEKKGELDPIILNHGEFYDGGHRLTAYKKIGKKEIPTIDIGFLLDLDWEKWDNNEINF